MSDTFTRGHFRGLRLGNNGPMERARGEMGIRSIWYPVYQTLHWLDLTKHLGMDATTTPQPTGLVGDSLHFAVYTKQLFCFQVFVRETRTPAFICLHKDWDRRVSVVSKEFLAVHVEDPFGSKLTVASVASVVRQEKTGEPDAFESRLLQLTFPRALDLTFAWFTLSNSLFRLRECGCVSWRSVCSSLRKSLETQGLV